MSSFEREGSSGAVAVVAPPPEGQERAPVASTQGDGAQVVEVGGRRYLLTPLDAAAPPRPPPPSLLLLRSEAAELLTERELQIAVLVADGLVNKQIAAELHISTWTVATHLRRIFCKLGVDTRAAMVCRCAGLLARRPGPGGGHD